MAVGEPNFKIDEGIVDNEIYNAHGCKLRFPAFEKAQFVIALVYQHG